jgi:hypothetical protein
MYSGFFGKRRSVSGASVHPADSRMVLCPVEPEEGLAGGQGRAPEESRASADALQICLLIGFMVLVCWCLSGCMPRPSDLPLLR